MNLRLLTLSLLLILVAGCAQDLADIDRTQTNRVLKSDLNDSDWFMAQTVTAVPTTNTWTFIGDTSSMERVRWEIQEDYIVAYRAYPRIADSQDDSDEDYTESPIAAFPVSSHFDIQRGYNSSTGEQTNVISENTSDNLWFDRKYMRVDWSTNLISNLELLSFNLGYTDFEYFLTREQDGEDSLFEAKDDKGNLNYFDFTTRMMVEPDPWGCFFTWYGWSAEDCTSAEIKLRTSFMKAEKVREYEPAQYEDRMMSKFGYFRTERYGYDRWRGIRQTNRKYLANRHAIWENVWQRDADGNILENEDGRPLVIPMSDRVPKPIVYYMSRETPEDLYTTSLGVGTGWDVAFRRAVAAAKGGSPDEVQPMFVVCHNPVVEDDADVCGEVGLEVRTGDIRYNHLYWVDQFTQAGLLGYGPSGADPLTGEIIFGAAYVYGAEVDSYAQYATDIVKLINGDLDEDDLQNSQYISDELRARLADDPSRPARLGALKNVRVGDVSKLVPKKADKLRMLKRHGLERSLGDLTNRQMTKAKRAGYTDMLVDAEIEQGLSGGKYGPGSPPPARAEEKLDPTQWAHAAAMRRKRASILRAAEQTLYHASFADDSILGLALRTKGQDYDKIRIDIRNDIFRAVMEHEVGHTIGLRHNFQGSYDSLNYHDRYWELRSENLIPDADLDELYVMSAQTETQKNESMYEFQYSSIMDYGMRFNSDLQGLGKYDEAAILFAYTTGTYDPVAGIEPGYVETYSNPGGARSFLRRYEDQDSLAYSSLLEEVHYTTVAQAFDSLDDIKTREIMRYGDLLAARETNPGGSPVEVSYMFCSDEWVGALVSCDVFDSGADPFEVAKHAMDHYRTYYPLSHYRRENPFIWSEDVLYRMYSRYFSPLTNVYQQWVFAYFYGTDDVVMDNYYLFAATSAFNFLAEVIATPQMGGYEKNADGVFELIDYGTDPEYELNIERGQGRSLYSEYEYESGYYYFDRISEVGHFWDYLAAVFALTDYQTTRLGVDASADELTYSIPWYMFFEAELTQVFNGVYVQDARIFGPRFEGGKVVIPRVSTLVADDGNGGDLYFDPETGQEVPDVPGGDPIDLDHSFTQQFYAGMYGMAFFTSNYSLNFPDQMKVFRLGAGESLEPGNGYEVVSFTDPLSGISYAALKPIGESGDTVAEYLVGEGARWANIYNTSTDVELQDDAFFQLQETVELINLSRGMYELFGTTF